jgi:hypothetical protein
MNKQISQQCMDVKEIIVSRQWIGSAFFTSHVPYGKKEIATTISFFNPEGNLYIRSKYNIPYGIIIKRDKFLRKLPV